jgi:Outer membrane protein beta-barrel domain
MKFRLFLSLALSLVLSSAANASEGTSTASIQGFESPESNDAYKVRLVPQVGITSLGYSGTSGGEATQTVSGGLTTEIGQSKQRLLETGFLFLQGNSNAKIGVNGANEKVSTSQLAIPLMAKIRFVETKEQSWYAKVGILTAFETSSNQGNATSPFDVLGSAGIGARFPAGRKADFLVEATYNRGVFNAFRDGTGIQEGMMIFTGISFGI